MSDEKTEEPSDKKLDDERKKGNVAKSKEVPSTLILLGVFGLLFSMSPFMLKTMGEFIVEPYKYFNLPFDEAFSQLLPAAFKLLCLMTLPFLGVIFVAGIVGNMGQIGFLLTLDPLMPKFSKMDPMSNLTNLFSKDNLFEFGMSLLKFGFLGYIFFKYFTGSLDAIVKCLYSGIPSMLPIAGILLHGILKTFLTFAFVIAAVDFLMKKKRYIDKNKMSKEEVKREHKQSEGDPHVKHMRKHLAQEMLEHNVLEETREADVLIVNPTHYAVAIAYNPTRGKLPVLLAKGKGSLALKMREVAEEEDIPIMRDIPLARSLFAQGTVDHFIPSEFIKPVAETLKWARGLRNEGWR